MNIKELELKSIEYRKKILEIIFNGGAGHTAGSLSCIDILNVLYNKILEINPDNFSNYDRNHFIQSKGHSVEALYTVLCDRNFFSEEDLLTLNEFNSHFIGHPTKKIAGIEHGAQNLDSRRRVFRQVGQRTGVRNQTRADKVSDERL